MECVFMEFTTKARRHKGKERHSVFLFLFLVPWCFCGFLFFRFAQRAQKRFEAGARGGIEAGSARKNVCQGAQPMQESFRAWRSAAYSAERRAMPSVSDARLGLLPY
jgi:hypothetical protein